MKKTTLFVTMAIALAFAAILTFTTPAMASVGTSETGTYDYSHIDSSHCGTSRAWVAQYYVNLETFGFRLADTSGGYVFVEQFAYDGHMLSRSRLYAKDKWYRFKPCHYATRVEVSIGTRTTKIELISSRHRAC